MENDMRKLDFNLPLCGRETELSILRQAFDDATNGSSSQAIVVRVSGDSGAGKSFLIDAFRQQVSKSCVFGVGKFEEQSTVAEPFSAIIDGLSEILGSVEDLKSFRNKLGSAVAPLSTIIPKLRDGDEESNASNTNATNFDRLKLAARDFLRQVCDESVVVLFLDDLQWAGSDSLEFIETLIEDRNSKNFLFIGAHRQVEEDHAVNRLFDALAIKVPLISLSLASVQQLIARLLKKESEEVHSLANVVHRKTGGVPIFVIQFLRYLEEKKYIYLSLSSFKWEWDLESIQSQTSVSDNVVDMIVYKIQTLSASSQLALTVAASSGLARFDLATLFSILQVTPTCMLENGKLPIASTEELGIILEAAVQDGLLEKLAADTYKFAHDRILESALSIVPGGREKKLLHYRIGQQLHKMSIESGDEAFVSRNRLMLLGVQQLNLGSDQVADQKTHTQLAFLNLDAADIAIRRSAFYPAVDFLEIGIGHLKGTDPWEHNYELSLKLFTGLAEMKKCCGALKEAREVANTVLQRAHTLSDKVRAYNVSISCLFEQGDIEDALKLSLEVLDEFNIHLPRRNLLLHLVLHLSQTKGLLRSKTDSDLLSLPKCTDQKSLMSLTFHSDLGYMAYQAGNEKLMAVAVVTAVQSAVKSGIISDYTCVCFAVYSSILGQTGDIKGAFRFAKLAIQLANEAELNVHKPHAIALAHVFSYHWMRPYHESLDPLFKAYLMSMEIGDIQHLYARMFPYALVYLCCGLRLAPFERDMKKFVDVLNDYSQKVSVSNLLPVWQMVLNLMGKNDDPLVLTGQAMDEDRCVDEWLESKNMHALQSIWKSKMSLAYYFGDLKLAEEMISKFDSYEKQGAVACLPVQVLFEGLVAIGLTKTTRKRMYRRIAKRKMNMLKKWVKCGAINCHYMLLFMKAEMYTLGKENDPMKVQELYDNAIATASKLGILHHRALANERVGIYFLGIGDTMSAQTYLIRARDIYVAWDAFGKVKHMEDKYSFLQASECARPTRQGSSVHSRERLSDIDVDQSRHRVLVLGTGEFVGNNGSAVSAMPQ